MARRSVSPRLTPLSGASRRRRRAPLEDQVTDGKDAHSPETAEDRTQPSSVCNARGSEASSARCLARLMAT
eukprot:1321244-Pyramimonas_sp.AAC.1